MKRQNGAVCITGSGNDSSELGNAMDLVLISNYSLFFDFEWSVYGGRRLFSGCLFHWTHGRFLIEMKYLYMSIFHPQVNR
jgi:hypothetical protein